MVAISLWAGALGCHFKAFSAINQRRSRPPARAPLAVPLTTPLNINTMEPSLRPLRYASARQHTFISVYTLHTRGQLIYLPCLRVKGGGGGGVEECTQAHAAIMERFMYSGGGWEAPGSGCTQRALRLALGALYGNTCKRLQPVRPVDAAQPQPCPAQALTWHHEAAKQPPRQTPPLSRPHWLTTATQLDISHRARGLTTALALSH